jgi:hypothetical protein
LPRDLQWAVGFRYGPGTKDIIRKDKFDQLVRRIQNVLEHSEQRRPELTEDEREARRLALWQISQALIRTTLIPRPEGSAAYAVDGTGLEAFERPPRKPKDLPDPDDHEEDVPLQPHDVVQEVKGCASGRGSKGRSDSKHGYRSDGAERRIYFGRDCEALIRAPMTSTNGKRSEPALLEALEVLPASTDIVEPVLRMIDLLMGDGVAFKELLADRHYSHKAYLRWRLELMRRGIEPISDLKVTDHVFKDWNGLRALGGRVHCPCTPDDRADIPNPSLEATEDELREFTERIEERECYALQVVAKPTFEQQRIRVRCPALNGTVGCPRREGTVAVAMQNEMPIIEVDDTKTSLACTQDTVSLSIETDEQRKQMKNFQKHYWGSRKWKASYSRRTHVEGFFGMLQNESIGGIKRQTHQFRGLAMNTIVLSVASALTNMHLLRSWHEDTGLGDPEHPLLKPDLECFGFKELTAEEAAELDERHRND